MGDNEAKILEFCLLAKNSRGLALVDLINKATSEPGVYSFGELLELSSIKELQNTEYAWAVELLKLFAYGTWKDYKRQQGEFPQLSEQQQLKIKQLTVVSKAQSSKTIPYDDLLSELDLTNIRELEDLIISDCFYAGVIKGKLDQKQRSLQVEEAIGRDVTPEQLPSLIQGVATWLRHTQDMLGTIEEKIAFANDASKQAQQQQEDLKTAIDKTKTAIREEIDAKNKEDAMLVDGEAGPIDFMDEERPGGRPKRRR